METKFIKERLQRYLQGNASPMEVKQIEAWLSSTHTINFNPSDKERSELQRRILYDVQCYTAYPLFFPKKNDFRKKLKGLFEKAVWGLVISLLVYFVAFYKW